jgi:hypothetical protein
MQQLNAELAEFVYLLNNKVEIITTFEKPWLPPAPCPRQTNGHTVSDGPNHYCPTILEILSHICLP